LIFHKRRSLGNAAQAFHDLLLSAEKKI